MKRYVIVRVDNTPICPRNYENIFCHYLVYHNYDKCDKCIKRYGDTKEQMVKKIMTAFKIAIKKNKEGKFVKEKSNNRQVAEIIVEFLGMK